MLGVQAHTKCQAGFEFGESHHVPVKPLQAAPVTGVSAGQALLPRQCHDELRQSQLTPEG